MWSELESASPFQNSHRRLALPRQCCGCNASNQIREAGSSVRRAVQWALPNGDSFLAATRTTSGYLLEFSHLADFLIDHTGSEILYSPHRGVPEHSVRHLILDTVIAFALSLRGFAVLHASAVVTPFGACAFAASSGIGKSTLAASFQPLGHPTLTDDCLLLESNGSAIFGIPSYPGARLRDDSLALMHAQRRATLPVAHYNSKRRLASGMFATDRKPLAAIYCLERRGRDDSLTIERVSGAESLLLALRYLFCLDPHDPNILVRQFKLVEHLLSCVPILRLTIPDDFGALSRVHKAVLADLKSRANRPYPRLFEASRESRREG